jgi:hypothetical protein
MREGPSRCVSGPSLIACLPVDFLRHLRRSHHPLDLLGVGRGLGQYFFDDFCRAHMLDRHLNWVYVESPE